MSFPAFNDLSPFSAAQATEIEQFVSYLQGWVGVQHKDDGSHAAVTADSMVVSGLLTAQIGALVPPLSTFAWNNNDAYRFTGSGQFGLAAADTGAIRPLFLSNKYGGSGSTIADLQIVCSGNAGDTSLAAIYFSSDGASANSGTIACVAAEFDIETLAGSTYVRAQNGIVDIAAGLSGVTAGSAVFSVDATSGSTKLLKVDGPNAHLLFPAGAIITANNTFLSGTTSGAATKSLIGVNASNKVAIDVDGIGATFGGNVSIPNLSQSGNGSVSATNGVATNLVTTSGPSMYLIWAYISGTSTQAWVVVAHTGAAASLLRTDPSGSIALTLSSATIQVTQTTGSTQTVTYVYFRIG